MIIDGDGFTEHSQESARSDEATLGTDSSNLDVLPSLGTSSQFLHSETDDGNTNEDSLDPQEDPKAGYNHANLISKLFWW